MSDDLRKRLRSWPVSIVGDVMRDAADRIEALEAENSQLREAVLEVTYYDVDEDGVFGSYYEDVNLSEKSPGLLIAYGRVALQDKETE